jgi:hypothetical protein
VDQARALTALNMVASAARNSKFDKIASGDANYSFPQLFSDSTTAATNPTIYHVRQADYSLRFYLLEDGTISKSGATSAKAVLYLLIDPPGTNGAPTGNNMVAGPLKINAFVVWPYRPSLDNPSTIPTTRTALAGRISTRSFLDTVITHYPEPVK